MRVSSVTLPSATGTLRSARTKTRFAFTSRSSRVLNAICVLFCHSRASGNPTSRYRTIKLDPRFRGDDKVWLDKLAHRHRGVGHAVGEAPFIIVPGHDR